jgi:predicted MFS family arabinose efflux permease
MDRLERQPMRPAATVSAAAAATALGVLPVFLLGALVVQIRADFPLSNAALGLSVSGFFALSALVSPSAGRLVERVGAGWGMAFGGLASALSMATAGLAGHWVVLAIGVTLGGLANATGQVAANLALAQAVPPHRQGIAFGIKQAAVPAATVLAGLAVPAVGLTVGWRWAFLAGAVLPLVFAAWALRSPVLRSQMPATRRRQDARRRADMTVRALTVLAFSGALGTFAANTLAAFLVDGTVSGGFSPASAGILLAAGSLSSVVVRVAVGSFVDARRFPLLPLVSMMLGAGAAGLVGLSVATNPTLVVVAAVVAYIGIWGWNGVFTLAIVRANPSAPAAATGVTQAGLYCGGVVGPSVFGYLAGTAGYEVAWWVTAAMAVLGAVGIGLSALRPPAVSGPDGTAGPVDPAQDLGDGAS